LATGNPAAFSRAARLAALRPVTSVLMSARSNASGVQRWVMAV
jgi:hypothetical protein